MNFQSFFKIFKEKKKRREETMSWVEKKVADLLDGTWPHYFKGNPAKQIYLQALSSFSLETVEQAIAAVFSEQDIVRRPAVKVLVERCKQIENPDRGYYIPPTKSEKENHDLITWIALAVMGKVKSVSPERAMKAWQPLPKVWKAVQSKIEELEKPPF